MDPGTQLESIVWQPSCADLAALTRADSTAFNPDIYFEHLANNASLPELLKRENELLTGQSDCSIAAKLAPNQAVADTLLRDAEIRELDGERQSLVYNHHHELIEASDTIRKVSSTLNSSHGSPPAPQLRILGLTRSDCFDNNR